jgi:uncharacterized protein (DUF849 family)
MNKVIISCAVTGAVHTPTMSEWLPVTPKQIEDQAVAAAEAGAAILHLHARDPQTGRPTPDPDVFMQFLPAIAARTDAVVNITTGGSVNMTLEQRLAAPLRARPEMASLNMGSMNFAFFPMAEKYSNWKYEWEKPYVEQTDSAIFRNTFKDVRQILEELGEGCGTRFEFECYDVGHLYNLAYFVDRKLVKPPFLIQSIFGILGGIGPDPHNVTVMRATADRLFGRDYVWSVLGAGRFQMGICTMAAIMGGNVRVGLEDSLFLGKGQLARSNAEQVAKIKRILRELSIDTASPDEARQILALKGRANVGF